MGGGGGQEKGSGPNGEIEGRRPRQMVRLGRESEPNGESETRLRAKQSKANASEAKQGETVSEAKRDETASNAKRDENASEAKHGGRDKGKGKCKG
jgi:hypothetical protein